MKNDLLEIRPTLRAFMKLWNWDRLKGDFAEVGVYEGDSARVIVDFCPEGKLLFLYDTFEGIPYHNEFFDNYHRQGDMPRSKSLALDKLKSFTKIVRVVPGIFPDSAASQATRQFCFANIDVDVYRSTKDCLDFFYPKLVKDGILMIQDDYKHVNTQGVTLAADGFIKNKTEKWEFFSDIAYLIKE